MSILMWPFTTLADLFGSGVTLAAFLAPFWAFGSILALPAGSYTRTGRSKWGWLIAATIGVWNPVIGIPTAIAHAVGPRRSVRREAEHHAALNA
jgi:hypothetical protein